MSIDISVRKMPEAAWTMYCSDCESEHRRADDLLDELLAMQDTDRQSRTFGQWPWTPGGSRGDLNMALFMAHDFLRNLWDVQDRMASDIRTRFLEACRLIVEAAQRRWDIEIFDIGRDFVAYSNIFVMWVQTFTLAADRFDDAWLRQKAVAQWVRWHNHIAFYGIDEFASPSYNFVILKALLDIREFTDDPVVRRQAGEVMDHVYRLQSAITHPKLKVPVCGISRDYRVFLKQADARSAVLSRTPEAYEPPVDAMEINERRRYPFEVIGKAAVNPFPFTSYQLEDAAMGSMTGGCCFQQQIHCMAAVGSDENHRAVVFMQGTNTPLSGFTDQKGLSALCVFSRLPSLWHLTQWRGAPADYREALDEFGIGLSPQWTLKSDSAERLVLEAFGYDLHIFPFAVHHDVLEPCRPTLKHRDSSGIRYHARAVVFDEYVFPDEPDWVGACVRLVGSGEHVENPHVTYECRDGVMRYQTNDGLRVRLVKADTGDIKQLFNVDPALIPLLSYGPVD